MAIYRQFRPKSRFFENFDQNLDFSKISILIEIFPNSDLNKDFSKIVARIETTFKKMITIYQTFE